MTAHTQDRSRPARAGISTTRQKPIGEMRTLLCIVGAVVLMTLTHPIRFRARDSRWSDDKLNRGSPPLGPWRPTGRSRRPPRRSASLERPGAVSRPIDPTRLPASAHPGAAGTAGQDPYPPGPPGFLDRSRPPVPPGVADPSRPPVPPGVVDPSGLPQPFGASGLPSGLDPSGPPTPPNPLDGSPGITDVLRQPREASGSVHSDHPRDPVGTSMARIPRPGQAARLRREIEEGVPEVIDVLRATVAAGINPRRALQAAAEGAPPALHAVLSQATRAAESGTGAGRALAKAAEGEQLSELVLAGEALDLAEMTGAPPGPVLAGVAAAAVDRVRSRRTMMAATAQARLSARVVAAMAPAFLAVLALTSPSDAAFLVREPLGWGTLATAAILESLGICWASRIVRGPAS
jgi:Type II secretion system (T2SS), protein F